MVTVSKKPPIGEKDVKQAKAFNKRVADLESLINTLYGWKDTFTTASQSMALKLDGTEAITKGNTDRLDKIDGGPGSRLANCEEVNRLKNLRIEELASQYNGLSGAHDELVGKVKKLEETLYIDPPSSEFPDGKTYTLGYRDGEYVWLCDPEPRPSLFRRAWARVCKWYTQRAKEWAELQGPRKLPDDDPAPLPCPPKGKDAKPRACRVCNCRINDSERYYSYIQPNATYQYEHPECSDPLTSNASGSGWKYPGDLLEQAMVWLCNAEPDKILDANGRKTWEEGRTKWMDGYHAAITAKPNDFIGKEMADELKPVTVTYGGKEATGTATITHGAVWKPPLFCVKPDFVCACDKCKATTEVNRLAREFTEDCVANLGTQDAEGASKFIVRYLGRLGDYRAALAREKGDGK